MKNKLLIISYILTFWNWIHLSAQEAPLREVRGAWIATVQNIDWPSRNNLSTTEQQAELEAIIDMHARNGLNTIVFQIRPASDAMYESNLEPWSEWLTGQQGKAPEPFWDPLEFAIRHCHQRGMELHAWLNPYRAVANMGRASISDAHVSKQHPEWLITYGVNQYLDPALPDVRKHVAAVVADLVKRYDLDAIHFDDYFYPYPLAGVDFPDSVSFATFGGNFYPDNLGDWRRSNVDSIIYLLNRTIKEIKPFVKFGIAPFGIWRNQTSDALGSVSRGLENYDALYADVRKWLKMGWIDYISPQLYWYIGYQHADFRLLLDWWSKNAFGRQVYAGHALFMAHPDNKTKAWANETQIPRQMELVRKTANIHGSFFYNSSAFKKDAYAINKHLSQNAYRNYVFPPTMQWIDSTPPAAIENAEVSKIRREVFLNWDKGRSVGVADWDSAFYFALYMAEGTEPPAIKPENLIAVIQEPFYFFERHWFFLARRKYSIRIVAYDRLYNESTPSGSMLIKK